MKAKHARAIREGIKEAKRFECFTNPSLRMKAVWDWANGMYCYGDPMASKSAFLRANTMVVYTERRLP